MTKSELISRLLDEPDVDSLVSLVRDHLDMMDHKAFFEDMRLEASTRGLVDKFTSVTKIHLNLSDSSSTKYLELAVRLLEANKKDRLLEQIELERDFINSEFMQIILDVIQENNTTGNLDTAFVLLYILDRIIQILGFSEFESYLYHQYSLYYLYTNNNQKAQEYIDKALKQGFDEAMLVNLGLIYFRDGQYKKAIEFYEALLQKRELKDENTISIKVNLSNCYGELGIFDKTNKILHEVESLNIKDKNQLAQVYGNLARNYGHMGRWDKERRYLLKATRVSKQTSSRDWHTILNNYINLSFFYQKEQNLKKAEYYLEVFKKYALQINTISYEITYARVKIKLLTMQKRLNEAEAIIDKMYKEFSSKCDEGYEYLSFLGVSALVKLHLQKLNEAKEYFSILNNLAIKTQHSEFIHISMGYLGVTEYFTLEIEKGLGNIKRCFEYEIDLRENIKEDIDQFFFSSNRENMYQLIVETLVINEDHILLFDILQKIKSTAISSKLKSNLGFDQFKKKLLVNSFYVDYYVKGKVAFCLVVCEKHEKPIFIKLDILEKDLQDIFIKYQRVLLEAKDYLFENPFAFLDDIASNLLNPLKKYMDDKEIVIFSRSSYLNHLPFQILKYEDKFLIEHIAISYTLHSSLIFCENDEYKDSIVIASSLQSDKLRDQNNFQKEFKTIEKILSNSFETKSYLNDKNSFDFLKNSSCDILHLLNHGEFSDNALKSGFYLKENGKDKFISLEELFKNRYINTKFIFMSGCDNGRVNNLKGEESLGVISYLHILGVKSAVLGMWKILSSQTTIDIVEDFYRYWIEEKNMKAVALQKAILKNKNSVNPYDWGGFALYGEGF